MINKTIDTDVLVVGGGWAGCEAAIKAKNEQNNVLLVDKGYVSRSGSSPFAAGSINICLPEDDKDTWLHEIVDRGEYLNDQEWVKLQLERGYPLVMEIDEWGKGYGHTILERDKQGRFIRKTARGNILTRTCVINALASMDTMRAKLIERKVSLLERVMVTDLVMYQGRVVGAIGLGYRDGTMYLLRAKSVVLATSGCGFKLFGIGHRSLTGEGQVMAYEAGAILRNIDQAMGNTTARAADLQGMSLMSAAGGKFLNNRGEEFMWNYEPEIGNRARLSKVTVAMAREIAAGNGPLYMDLTGTSEEDQKLLRKIVPEAFRAFAVLNIDPFKEKVEWMPAFKGTLMHGGGIHIDIDCATNIPGLYSAGDCTCTPEHGTWSVTGLNITFAIVSGEVAGRSAAGYASEAPPSQALRRDVEDVVASRLAPLDVRTGLTPDEIIYRIQSTMNATDVAYIRSEDSLLRALREIEEIRDEVQPRVKATNAHELVKALETKSMVRIAEMIVRSILDRKESRGFHYRTDYPLTDNDQWLKWMMVQRGEDGSMRVWAQSFPTPYITPPSGKYPPK